MSSKYKSVISPTRLSAVAALALTLSLALSSCSKSAAPAATGNTFSGTMSSGGHNALRQFDISRYLAHQAVALFDLSTLSVVCTGADGTQASGAVSSTGTFSVTVTSLPNPIVCDVFTGAATSPTATFLYPTGASSMAGTGLNTDSVTVSGTVSTGAVVLDTASGEISVPTVTSALSTANSFDFSGDYTIALADSVPTGYLPACPEGDQNHNDTSCAGPQVGQSMFLKLLTGTQFTPDSTCAAGAQSKTDVSPCNGTASSTPAYGIMVWQATKAQSWDLCGDTLGYTFDQAKEYASIDFSQSGITGGAPVWAAPEGHTLVSGSSWEIAGTTSQYAIQNCWGATDDTGAKSLWICYDQPDSLYMINDSTNNGCTDAVTQAPVQLSPSDWSGLTSGNCSNSDESIVFGGQTLTLHMNSCTYSAFGSFTNGLVCTGGGATFTNSGTPASLGTFTPSGGNFNFTNATILNQGDLCSNLSGDPNFALQLLQCYANANQNHGGGGAAGCTQDVRTNWNATKASDFILNDGMPTPANLFAVERLDFPAAGVLHFFHQQDQYNGVQAGTNNWVACHTRQHMSIFARKVNTNQLETRFEQETVLIDTDKPACAADAAQGTNGSLQIGTIRGIFKFVPAS